MTLICHSGECQNPVGLLMFIGILNLVQDDNRFQYKVKKRQSLDGAKCVASFKDLSRGCP
jgi:hypothetical protein